MSRPGRARRLEPPPRPALPGAAAAPARRSRLPRPRWRGPSRRQVAEGLRVTVSSARRSARLRGDEHRHRQHRHGFGSQHGE